MTGVACRRCAMWRRPGGGERRRSVVVRGGVAGTPAQAQHLRKEELPPLRRDYPALKDARASQPYRF